MTDRLERVLPRVPGLQEPPPWLRPEPVEDEPEDR